MSEDLDRSFAIRHDFTDEEIEQIRAKDTWTIEMEKINRSMNVNGPIAGDSDKMEADESTTKEGNDDCDMQEVD